MALRFQQSNYDFADVPIPTTRQPPRSGATMRRAKTLTRPERGVAPVPLINPHGPPPSTPQGGRRKADDYNGSTSWRYFSLAATFWAPNFLLSSFGGMRDTAVRQAWREKIALCFIILVLCAVVGFATVGFQKILCPENSSSDSKYLHVGEVPGILGVQGIMFNVTSVKAPGNVDFANLVRHPGQDITAQFTRSASEFSECRGLKFRIALDDPCPASAPCPLPSINSSSTFKSLAITNTGFLAGYSWDQVASLNNYMVIDGAVLNMQQYMKSHSSAVPGDAVDKALRTIFKAASPKSGKDGTRLFSGRPDLASAIPCLKQRYLAGKIDKIPTGCFITNLFLYSGLIVILGLVFVRFIMACIFNWFLSAKLAGPPNSSDLNRSVISPAVMPEGANVSIDNKTGTAPWAGTAVLKKAKPSQTPTPRAFASSSSATLINNDTTRPTMTLAQIGAELFAVCLVTCYSEGEDSIRTTLDSISTTTYSDARKLLFVVADGMITGAGEKRSTPDICVSLLDADPRFGNPIPMSYSAVGAGQKAHNRAMVYAGHYSMRFVVLCYDLILTPYLAVAGRRTPTVIVVKCGTEQEAISEKKPGNRGKRDSQLILMNFFSRVTYNDRMSPLDFDLFRKINVLMGVTPDFFEVVLMVSVI